jgi:hypothetical protein
MKATPIQEAIQEIDAKLNLADDYDDLSLYQRGLVDAYINIKKLLESKLEKEKDDLIGFAQSYIISADNAYVLFTKTFNGFAPQVNMKYSKT